MKNFTRLLAFVLCLMLLLPPTAAFAASAPGAPVGLLIMSNPTDASRVAVTWFAPADGGLPITGYTVVVMHDSVLVDSFPVTDTHCVLTDLEPRTQYTVYVSASNASGEGPQTHLLYSTPDPIFYNIRIAGTRVTNFNCAHILGDDSVRFDPLTATLYLTDADVRMNNSILSAADVTDPIYSTSSIRLYPVISATTHQPLTVVLAGNNRVTQVGTTPSDFSSCGFLSDSDTTFTGDGTLRLQAGVSSETSGASVGIYVGMSVTFDARSVVCVGGRADLLSAGMLLCGPVFVKDGAGVEAMGGAAAYSYGAVHETWLIGASPAGIIGCAAGSTTVLRGGTLAAYLTPDLSGCPDAEVRVDTASAGANTQVWDGVTPLGGDASPYKYIRIGAPLDVPDSGSSGYGYVPADDAPGFTSDTRPAPDADANPNTGAFTPIARRTRGTAV